MRIFYIIAILLLLLMVGCTPKDKYVEPPKPKVSTISSTYQDIDIISEFYDGPNMKYTIHYPSFKTHQNMPFISDYIHELKEDFKTKANETYELHTIFKIEYHSEKYASIIFNVTEKVEENSKEYIKTFFVDLETEKEVRLEELFTKGQDYKTILSAFTTESNFEKFTITKEGLTIYTDTSTDFVHWEKIANHLDSSFVLKPEIPKEIVMENPRLKEKMLSRSKRIVEKPKTKMIAITFDDGPHSSVTPRILDMLKKYDAKATFFMVGERVQYYPELVKRVAEEGHELANHTWSHPSLTSLSIDGMLEQINKTDSLLESISGVPVTLIRPPYGAYNDTVQSHVTGPLINWSVDTLDWKNRNANTIMNTIEGTIGNGSIILMHDLYESTAEAAERIVKQYTELGYSFVTVSELLGFNDAQPVNGKVYTRKE